MKIVSLAALVGAALSACTTGRADKDANVIRADWRNVTTEDDRRRLRDWRKAWVEALDKAKRAGHGAAIAAEGALFKPDAAIELGVVPEGDYRCRVIKLGGKMPGMLDFISYPRFNCRITRNSNRLDFTKLDGSQRPKGHFFPHMPTRMVFLGTLELGDEGRPLSYGTDQERNMAGFLERVDGKRLRLIFPYPHFESTLDVLELVPVGS